MHDLKTLHVLNKKHDRHCTACLRPYTEENAYTIVKDYMLKEDSPYVRLCGKCASEIANLIQLYEVR